MMCNYLMPPKHLKELTVFNAAVHITKKEEGKRRKSRRVEGRKEGGRVEVREGRAEEKHEERKRKEKDARRQSRPWMDSRIHTHTSSTSENMMEDHCCHYLNQHQG